MPLNFIYCREYGLQPAIQGLNFGISEAYGNPLVIINQSVKPTVEIVNTKNGMQLVEVKRVLYSKLITLSNFNGYDNLYIGKKSDFYFQNVPFDFVNDKWRIRNLSGSNLNNYKFNVYDRTQIKNILSTFLTRKQDEVFNMLYTEIPKADGLKKFLAILEAVIELKDDFTKLLTPAEEQFLEVPDGIPGVETGKQDITQLGASNPTNNSSTTKTVIGLSALAIALYVMKKKKVI